MVIDRRKRKDYMGKVNGTHSISKMDNKISYNFDIDTLSLFFSYVLSENKNIKRGHLVNLRNLFAVMDMEVYAADPERKKIIEMINRGLEARLARNLANRKMVLMYIKGGALEENEIDNYFELSNSELEYINETISGALACMVVENEMEAFFQLFTKYKARDYRYRAELIGEFQTLVGSIHNQFRQTKMENRANTFSFDPKTVKDDLYDIYDNLTSPHRFLKCQMEGVNLMFGNGFEAGRFYLILGNAGVGKSLTILDLAMQIKAANKGIICKDPTKRPTIVFLTQENSMEETVERVFQMISGHKMVGYSKEEVYKILLEDGELALTEIGDINIHIIFKPDRSIDTSDLYTIIEDLEDDGYETIMLFQDHIKRIRSVDRYNELRLELGAVVNEFKTLAILKQIPVVSISHLNRDAAKVTDPNITGNKVDLTRLLGRQNVGESYLMIDNADAAVILGAEYDSEGNKWLGWNLIKLRYAEEVLSYIVYPYNKNNKIKIMTDSHLPEPIYKTTLKPTDNLNNRINGSVMKTSSYGNNMSILEEEPSLFDGITGQTFSSVQDTFTELENTSQYGIDVVPHIVCEDNSDMVQLVQWIA